MPFARLVRIPSNPSVAGALRLLGTALALACFAVADAHAQTPVDSFHPNANSDVYAMAVQPDGKILVGGAFTNIASTTRNHIARLNANGTLDTSFNPGADGIVMALVVQPDGKILVGGLFSTLGGMTRNRVGRLNADGTLDTSFVNPVANGDVRALALTPLGQVLVGGYFSSLGGSTRSRIGLLNDDGTLDTSFVNPAVVGTGVLALALQPDGKILAGGVFTTIGGTTRGNLGRLNADGTLDTSFLDPAANSFVSALLVQPDGRIVVGGVFTQLDGSGVSNIGRLEANGTRDNSFSGAGADGAIRTLVLQPDGKILVGGAFTQLGGVGSFRFRLARINPNGSLDTAFNPSADNVVYTLARQPDGKILVGGSFTLLGAGTVRNYLGRVVADVATQEAVYDATLKAPACATVEAACGSGTLLVGRGSTTNGVNGPEPNQPNTLDACTDGLSGFFHVDGSNDYLRVSTVSGARLGPGELVRVEADVWAPRWPYYTVEVLDLYATATPAAPVWTHLGTIALSGPGAQTLSTTYVLPAGPRQAVRAHYRAAGSQAACTVGAYEDHDDLVFAVAPDAEFMSNGDFSTGTTGWLTYGDISSAVNAGVFEYYWVPDVTPSAAVVFQQTGQAVPTNTGTVAQFSIGNSSSARKRISVLMHDQDFTDLSVCTFWLEPSSPLATYIMYSHTTEPWTGATISFYAATQGEDGGRYQLDNVSFHSGAGLPNTRTDCIDPTAPVAPGGANGPNLLGNGDFGSGALTPWTVFGTATWQIVGTVFEYIRPTGTPPAGVVLQASGTALSAHELLTAKFDLGNSSAVRKRVTVLLHDLDFSDLTACTWWLEPFTPLGEYQMRTFVSDSAGWGNATLSLYAATVGTEQWIRLDNATLQRTPSGTALGTECFEPGDPAAPLLVAGGSSSLVAAGTPSGGLTPPDDSEPITTSAGEDTTWQAVANTGGTHTLDWPRTIDLRGASTATLSFQSWLSTRRSSAEVQVTSDGVTWHTVSAVPPSDDWTWLAVDLSEFAGQVVQVRFVFDAVAPAAGDAEDRWLVREVRVNVGPPSR